MTYGKSTKHAEIREIGAVRSTVLALALLATAGRTLAGERTAEATPELEWGLCTTSWRLAIEQTASRRSARGDIATRKRRVGLSKDARRLATAFKGPKK